MKFLVPKFQTGFDKRPFIGVYCLFVIVRLVLEMDSQDAERETVDVRDPRLVEGRSPTSVSRHSRRGAEVGRPGGVGRPFLWGPRRDPEGADGRAWRPRCRPRPRALVHVVCHFAPRKVARYVDVLVSLADGRRDCVPGPASVPPVS